MDIRRAIRRHTVTSIIKTMTSTDQGAGYNYSVVHVEEGPCETRIVIESERVIMAYATGKDYPNMDALLRYTIVVEDMVPDEGP